MSKPIERIKENATKLMVIRRTIQELKEKQAQELEHWEKLKDEVQTSLLLQFEKEGITSIKSDDGSTCSKAIRKGIEVTSDIHAFKWAYENRAVSINKILVKQKLEPVVKAGGKLPDGFDYKEVAYISVRSPKKEGEVEAAKE